MTLRKFQKELYGVCREIIKGKVIKKLFLDVCPGGGKSTAPAIMADTLLNQKVYDKICWIAPRENLVIQGENDFINSFISHGKIIRSAKNKDINLSKDRNGYITTMQSVIANTELHEKEIASCRYILFIDEFHFLSLNNTFKNEIDKLINLAALVVFASGTIERGQGDKVAYVPYKNNGEIDFSNTKGNCWIRYHRIDALKENAISHLKFHTVDGSGKYIDKQGLERTFSNLGYMSDNLNCALQTGFSNQLIDKAYSIYLKEREKYPAKLIIIAPNIETGNRYKNYLQSNTNEQVEIATSENTPAARKNIKQFKKGNLDILVGIGMFYIGFSCKQVGVICALTNIRSGPWLDQMSARCNRLYPGKKYGHIIAPADIRFKRFISRIYNEQKIIACEIEESKKQNESMGDEKIDITPIYSEAHIDDKIPEENIPDSEVEISLRKKITEIINQYIHKKSIKAIGGKNKIVKTESMRHRKLIWMRISQIVNHGRDVNGKLQRKKIDEMTITELKKVHGFVNDNYA